MISILVVPGESEILPTAIPIFCSPPKCNIRLTTGILEVGLQVSKGMSPLPTPQY